MKIRVLIKNLIFFSKKGASGGPLICGSKEKEKLYGVSSWGIGCLRGLDIYARVTFYRNWIDKEINVTRFFYLKVYLFESIC